jgi:5,10-methylenetetrahydrofolate reductase
MRFELTLRDEAAIEGAAALLREYGIRAVNVTDVSKKVDPVRLAGHLSRALPGIDVMPHVAAKHHDAASFREMLACADSAGVGKVLAVSGFPRGSFDAIKALGGWGGRRSEPYCVYNPYFTGDALRAENMRLKEKLAFPAVRGVCLQIGMDRKAFIDGMGFVRALRSDVRVLASLPIPSESLLRRLKTKALYGVFLDASYYFSSESALRITRDMVGRFKEEGIEPVVFSDGFSREAIDMAMVLWK